MHMVTIQQLHVRHYIFMVGIYVNAFPVITSGGPPLHVGLLAVRHSKHSTAQHSTTQHNCAQPEVLVVQWAVCLLPKPVCVCMRACLQRNILHFAVDTALCLLYFQSYTKFRKCLNFFFSWHYNPQWGLYEYFTAL